MAPPLPRRIGLVADSHSELDCLDAALTLLRDRGAEALVHLGDICDSLRLDLLASFVELLGRHGVVAVKGNNDFMLENLLHSRPPELVEKSHAPLLAFLRSLPMKIEWESLCFAHSLPFDALRAFYEPIDTGSVDRAQEVFSVTDHRILFCGHSHQPVLFRSSGEKVTREQIPEGTPVSLEPQDRFIAVTGAVAEGECALFDSRLWQLERIRMEGCAGTRVYRGT